MRKPAAVRSLFARLYDILAAGVSLSASFLVPFVAASTLDVDISDVFILSLGISLTLWNVVALNLELYTISASGRLIEQEGRGRFRNGKNYGLSCLGFGVVLGILATGVLILVYVKNVSEPSLFIVCAAICSGVPIVGSYNASVSGQLIALGDQRVAVSSQGLRGFVALPSLFWVEGSQVVWTCALLVCGEILRSFILWWRLRSLAPDLFLSSAEFRLGAVSQQSLATSTAQVSPLVDRFFLSAGGAGSISAYELADKVFFALVQVLNLSALMRIVARWARISDSSDGFARRSRKDLLRLAGLAASAAVVVGFVVVSIVYFVPLPNVVRQGLLWSLILLISAPLAMVNSGYGRLAIVTGRQRALVWFAGLQVVMNVGLDVVLVWQFGVVGVIVASVVVRLVSVIAFSLYFTLLDRRRGTFAVV